MSMRNLHLLENSELIDMLAEYTLKFTHLFSMFKGIHPSQEYQKCKKAIGKIVSELDKRGLIPNDMSSQFKDDVISLFSK